MSEKYQIIMDFIKDLSFEIPNTDAYISSIQDLDKYETKIDIKNKLLKDELYELNLKIQLQSPQHLSNRVHAELCIAIIFKILKENTDETEIKKMLLADIPNLYSKKITDIMTNLFQQSGFKEFKFKKNLDFIEFYENQKNTNPSN